MRLLELYSKQKATDASIRSFKSETLLPWKEKLRETQTVYGVRTKADIKERIEILEQELSQNLITNSERSFTEINEISIKS